MKIYTKTGDKGDTGLIGGTRVKKSDSRIAAYGTVDELNAWVGLLRSSRNDATELAVLGAIQNNLFTIGSQLAADPEKSRMQLPELHASDITQLEEQIDAMNAALPELRSFILPGGNTTAAYGHLARTVCRRAERKVVALQEQHPLPAHILTYLNRLSDYFFTLSRYACQLAGDQEIKWEPRKS